MDEHGLFGRRRMTVPSKFKPSSRLIVVTPSYSKTEESHLRCDSDSNLKDSGSPTTLFPKLFTIDAQGSKSFSTSDIPRVSDLLSMHMDISDGHFKDKFKAKENGTLDASSKSHVKSNPDSFFCSLRPCLYLMQCCALLPISGISGPNPEHLRFRWKHWKMGYVGVALSGIGFLFICSIQFVFRSELTYDKSAPAVFYGTGVVAILLFLSLARNWAELSLKFADTERLISGHGYPRGLHIKFITIIIFFLVFALVEHILSIFVDAVKIVRCANDEDGFFDGVRIYFLNQYRQVFSLFNYHIMIAIPVFLSNFISTCTWNFTDLFLGLMGLSLSARLRQVNDSLALVHGQEKPTTFWRKMREDFNAVSVLVKTVDEHIQRIMLLSLGNNLFFVCLQLLMGLKKRINTYQVIYFFWSLGFLIIRTFFVTLCSAGIYDESRAGKSVLFSVPHDSFCQEVRRFLTQLTSDDLALTGCRFFSVTRSLILTIAGTVVTYEIVLVQFKSDGSDVEDWTNKTNCASIRR